MWWSLFEHLVCISHGTKHKLSGTRFIKFSPLLALTASSWNKHPKYADIQKQFFNRYKSICSAYFVDMSFHSDTLTKNSQQFYICDQMSFSIICWCIYKLWSGLWNLEHFQESPDSESCVDARVRQPRNLVTSFLLICLMPAVSTNVSKGTQLCIGPAPLRRQQYKAQTHAQTF